MFCSRTGQASTALLAGSIVVLLIGIGILAVAYMERGGKEESLAQSEKDLKKAEAELKAEVETYKEISKYVGFLGAEGLTSVSVQRGFCEKRGLYSENLVKKTFQRYLEDKEGELNSVLAETAKLLRDGEDLRNKEKEVLTELDTMEKEKNKEIGTQHTNRKRVDAALRKLREQNREQINLILENIEVLNAEIFGMQQAGLKEKLELEKEIAELEKRIYIVTVAKQRARKKIEEADGRILAVEPEMRYAYIDIGKEDGLTKGSTFVVFDLLKGGIKKEKGEIRVEEVGALVSKVAIINEYDLEDPIAQDDLISSEVFDREKIKVFVFIGRLRGKYTNEEARRKVQEVGWNVADEVTLETSYLVLGEGYEADKNFEEARRLGVHILMEDQFLEMLGE